MELSLRERDRMAVMRQAREGALAVSEAAARLGMTRHHTRRLMRRFERGGDGAAVHGLRGRRSNRTHAPEVRKRVLALAAAAVYSGFGPTALGELVQWGDSLVHPWIEDRGSASRSRPPTRATRIVGRDYTVRWKNGGGCRASCASVAASGTSPPSRWAPSVLRRRPLLRPRLVRVRSLRSRDRIIRGASRSAPRSSAPSPGRKVASLGSPRPPRSATPAIPSRTALLAASNSLSLPVILHTLPPLPVLQMSPPPPSFAACLVVRRGEPERANPGYGPASCARGVSPRHGVARST